MEPFSQPARQTWLGGGQIHTRHANLGKSEFQRPRLDAAHEKRTVDLTAAERHPAIVESAPATAPAGGEGGRASLLWRTEDDTAAFARQLAALPAVRHAFIELHGDLGAGKTTLVRHLLRALGVQGRIKSPTYAVVEPHTAPPLAGHDTPLDIWHFDFYRFNDPREWEDAGFRDVFASAGLKLAEWPEKAAAMLPRADLAVYLEAQTDASRTVQLRAHTPTGEALLQGMVA